MKKLNIKDVEEFSRAPADRRKELKITQKDLANYCNLTKNGINQIKLGNKKDVKLSTILKISKILSFKIVLEMDK